MGHILSIKEGHIKSIKNVFAYTPVCVFAFIKWTVLLWSKYLKNKQGCR